MCAAFAAISVSAAERTWLGGTGNLWSDPANWQDGALPAAGDTVVLASDATAKNICLDIDTPLLGGIAIADRDAAAEWQITNRVHHLAVDGDFTIGANNTLVLYAPVNPNTARGLVKRGVGSLSLCATNTFSGKVVVEEGRVMADFDEAYGVCPATLVPDAIILRNRGILGNGQHVNNMTIAATRGITIEQDGELCPRNDGAFTILSPITGTGDLYLCSQVGVTVIGGACTYTGKTYLGGPGRYATQNQGRLRMIEGGSLPPATELVITEGYNAILNLNETTQEVAGITANATFQINAGTLIVRTDAGEIPFTNIEIMQSANLVFDGGSGCAVPAFAANSAGTFFLAGGSMRLAANTALGKMSLVAANGTAITTDAGVTALANSMMLNGTVKLTTAETVTLTGSLSTAGEAETLATLRVEGAGILFGTADRTIRTFDINPVTGETTPVILTGYIWSSNPAVRTLPTQGETVFFGSCATTGGGQTIDGTGVGVSNPADLGSASESVTVQNNGTLILYAASGIPPADDPDAVLTVAYAVALDATSTLRIAGAGLVQFDGSLSGNGAVEVEGNVSFENADLSAFTGTLNLTGKTASFASADLRAVPVTAANGTLAVKEDGTLTLGTVSGTLKTAGAGTVRITGSEAGQTVTLTVSEGVTELAAPAACVENGTIVAGATLRLAGDNGDQIADTATLRIDGTFDLNGCSETVARYHNEATAHDRNGSEARIINSSETEAILTSCGANANARSYFFGAITETVGKIRLAHSGPGGMGMFGASGAIAPSSIALSDIDLITYNTPTEIEFRFHEAKQSSYVVSVAEIQLTYQGIPIPEDAINRTGSYASSNLNQGESVGNLFDNDATTFWKPAVGQKPASVYIRLNYPVRVDGYRLCAPPDWQNRPITWDVYTYRWTPTNYVLADSRKNETIVDRPTTADYSGNWSSVFTFNQAIYPRDAFGEETDIELLTPGKRLLRLCSAQPIRTGRISGPGQISLEDGTTFAPADLTGWTGEFVQQNAGDAARLSRVLLDAERGAAEQPARIIHAGQANISIENGTGTPVALLLDESYEDGAILYGRLADGAGKMGLVKRGVNRLTLNMQDAAYTGETRIEAGTLRVVGAIPPSACTARYLRFTPSAYSGTDNNGYNWGMNDFQLLAADGTVVPIPAGTTLSSTYGFHATANAANMIDGNISTRCLVMSKSGSQVTKFPFVTFDFGIPVTFSGYRWYTPHGNDADKNRVSTQWTLEASLDGTVWDTVDARTDPYSPSQYGSGNAGQLRGPYALEGESAGTVDSLHTLPAAFFAETDERVARNTVLKARYFRFAPYEIRTNTGTYSYGWQIAEFSLFKDGERIPWTAAATASSVSAPFSDATGPANAINNNLEKSGNNRFFSRTMPNDLIIDAGEAVTFDAYGFVYGPNTPERQPVSWDLFISGDGETWHRIDNRNNLRAELTASDFTTCGPFSIADRFPLLSAGPGNALGDASPVTIAANAALELKTGHEVFGPLSGDGMLALLSNACADINVPAETAARFDGSVSGQGILAKSGAGTQALTGTSDFQGELRVYEGTLSLDQVALDGVNTLTLKGGSLNGTGATLSGQTLDVAFSGGTYLGTMTGIGTLSVTGDVVYAVPEGLDRPFHKVLFTYDAIDSASADALRQGIPEHPLPQSLQLYISVTEHACKLSYGYEGTVIILK